MGHFLSAIPASLIVLGPRKLAPSLWHHCKAVRALPKYICPFGGFYLQLRAMRRALPVPLTPSPVLPEVTLDRVVDLPGSVVRSDSLSTSKVRLHTRHSAAFQNPHANSKGEEDINK